MATRHRIKPGEWETIVARLQELVLANSGEDEFQEIFKILVAKMYSEINSARAPTFRVAQTPVATADSINELLAGANAQWSGIISGEPRSKLAEEHLAICVEAIQEHSIFDTSLEVMDQLFEYLVSRDTKGEKGQYFTPRQVVECCVKIIDPLPTETVLDPACGSGGFLLHALIHNSARADVGAHEYSAQNLWGTDFDARAVQIAKALMLVAGDGSANIHQLNSLRKPSYGNLLEITRTEIPRITIEDLIRSKVRNFRGFDVILTNPPFAGEIREDSLLESYEIVKAKRRMERDALFLERCVELLRPGGRIGIVLPHNKFGSANWSYLREWLLRHVRVTAVVGLDRYAFLPHTAQKTSVLFGVKRHKPIRDLTDEPIYFAISESAGKDSKGRTRARVGTTVDMPNWQRADHDLGEVVEGFQEFKRQYDVPWSG